MQEINKIISDYKKPIWRKNRVNQIEDWHDGDFLGYLDNNKFPEVTFENSPMEVELKLYIKNDTKN